MKLLLVRTTVPANALKSDILLPACAALSVKEGALFIALQVRRHDKEEWEDWDEPDAPTASIQLDRNEIRFAVVGGTWSDWYTRFPTAVISIRDPLGVEESLELTFASTDANNPNYWIKVLAKLLTEHLQVAVHDAMSPPSEDEVPF